MTKQKHNKTGLVAVVLLTISAFYLLYIVVYRSSMLHATFDPAVFKKAYEESQWMVPNSKKPIGDTWLYAYSGYKYINGENPILISPEVPPAGKYLIGIFILLFHNYQLVSLFAALLTLFFIHGIVRMHTRSPLPAALAVWITSLHPIFVDQLTTAPQLEIIQICFLMLFLYLFTLYEKKRQWRYLIFSAIGLGLFVSTKLVLIFFPLAMAWLFCIYVFDKKRRARIFTEIPLIVAVTSLTYIVTYSRLFILGASVMRFLGMHKWIYTFYAISQIQSDKLYGSFLTLIFFNQWKVWSEGYPTVTYQNWTLYWPAIMIVGIVCTILFIIKKHSSPLFMMVLSLVAIYSVILFFIPIFPRYLVMLFIPLHILIALYIDTLVS